MKRRSTATEAELAEVVIAYLEELGGDVYQEVACAGGYADIVARVGAELWIVETKVSLSLALLCQALERRRSAHRVFIAAPYTRNMWDVTALCRELGIGLLDVRPACAITELPASVHERAESRRWNTRPVALAAQLSPQHKVSAKAGTAGGGRWTPFRNTCDQLVRVVRESPGITMKDAIDGIKHHYASSSSARGALATWVERGKLPGVKLVRGLGVMRLWPTDGGEVKR